MMGIGIACLLGKLHKWDESAIWFDGSSLGMTKPITFVSQANEFRTAVFVFAITVYLAVTIPALKAVVNPADADSEFTLEQSLGVLGAGNTIIAGLLLLILVMQARHTVDVKVTNDAERFFFSSSGWTGVREAYGSKGISHGREGKDQGCKVRVISCCDASYACITLMLTTLWSTASFPCTLGPIQFSGCFRGVLRNRYTLTTDCLLFKTRSQEKYRFSI